MASEPDRSRRRSAGTARRPRRARRSLDGARRPLPPAAVDERRRRAAGAADRRRAARRPAPPAGRRRRRAAAAEPPPRAAAGRRPPPPPAAPARGTRRRPPKPPKPPGLREQAARTIAAGRRLVDAHVALAKAELAVILDDVKQVAALVGIAARPRSLYVVLLVSVGMALFLGEWIFGSMGWGILHGTLFSIATAVILVLSALRISRALPGRHAPGRGAVRHRRRRRARASPCRNAAYAAIAESAAPGIETRDRGRSLVGVALWGAIFALVGLLLGARAGGVGGALGGFFAGAIVGALFGAFTAISFSPQVGAALGVTVDPGRLARARVAPRCATTTGRP